jgi:bifunctional oligoribonuclease and PAP phosphatase NrnA
MRSAGFSEIREALRDRRSVLVTGHIRPDADAYGSMIAASLWLRSEGHDVTVWNADGMLSKFSFLPSSGMVTPPSATPVAFDAVLVLDTSLRNRIGSVADAVAGSPLWICIDHHKSNEGYADLNLIDPSRPATGEILAESFLAAGITITQEMATNLFAAISTDTGSFQYEGTSARTYEVAAELIRRGVDVASISRSLYENQPKRRLALLRHALVHSRFACDDWVASFSLTLEDGERLGVIPEDNEGIIDHLRSVEGVRAAAFFEELPGEMVRLSLRSKDPGFDACALCARFGGGGHTMASGARIKGSLREVEERVLDAICKEISGRRQF